MRKFLLALVLTCLLPSLASAANLSVSAGVSQARIRAAEGGDWNPATMPSGGLSYDIPLAGERPDGSLSKGLSLSSRGSADVETDLLLMYIVEWWSVEDHFEWFVGGQLVLWKPTITGSDEVLGGVRAGLRFDAGLGENGQLEVSANWSGGEDGIEQFEIFFGPRLTTTLGGG